MTAGDFVPLVRAANLLGFRGLAVILVFCWVVFPAVTYLANRRTGSLPPLEHWLIHSISFLVMWYFIATTIDQVRHGPYEFESIWPSSFAVSAFFASAVFPMAFRKARGVRWFLVVAFLSATAFFGLGFQVFSWILPRYAAVMFGAS